MENLPNEITIDILSRVPAESILHCRQVCKSWQSLLRYRSFTHMHLRRSLEPGNGKAGFLYLNWSDEEETTQLYYGAYDENDEHYSLTRINHPPIKKYWNTGDKETRTIVGSCNGLICFSVPPLQDPIYICNPITRDCINLPRFRRYDCEGFMVSGFGYLPSTNEYKVVRIFYHYYDTTGEVQVYTFGGRRTPRWRYKARVNHVLCTSPAVLANGALHWFVNRGRNRKIIAFDLADEEFHLLPSPPFFYPMGRKYWRKTVQLRVLGGLFCVVDSDSNNNRIDIWSWKKKKKIEGDTTSNEAKEQEKSESDSSDDEAEPFKIEGDTSDDEAEEHDYRSRSWTKELKIRWYRSRYFAEWFKPFAITTKGEVLLLYKHKIVVRYDRKILKKVAKHDNSLDCFEAIPHMNSLVSLRAFELDGVERIPSVEDVAKPEEIDSVPANKGEGMD